MRALPITGAVLIAIGAWFLIRPPSFSHEESVFKIGGVEAKVQQERPVPAWIGGVALGAGLVLVVMGLRAR